jgi:hypothetical protein
MKLIGSGLNEASMLDILPVGMSCYLKERKVQEQHWKNKYKISNF